jgi:Cft2 family RNA processing exonuclease
MKTVFYESYTTNWSSEANKDKIYGKKNHVIIKNNIGKKTSSVLNASGKIVRHKTRKLNKKEIKKILKGKFIPGFWKNCTLKNGRGCGIKTT